MDQIIIREAEAGDYEHIHELNKYAFGYDYPIQKTEENLSLILAKPSNKIFVAMYEDQKNFIKLFQNGSQPD